MPCDACAGVQAALQDVAHAVASLCQTLGLSCSLWSFLQAMEEMLQLGRLSACDLALWAREQQQDLGRIQSHVTYVRNRIVGLLIIRLSVLCGFKVVCLCLKFQEKVDSLTHSVWKAEKERDGLIAQMEREKETSTREREESRKREEEWLKKLQEEKHRQDEELKKHREEQEEFRRGSSPHTHIHALTPSGGFRHG